MPEDTQTPTVTDPAVQATGDPAPTAGTATAAGDPPGADALGDPGKKALDAMKAERNSAKSELAALKAELDALKAAQEGREAEHKASVEAQRVKDEALEKANDRIRKAEIRAQAATKLADPADALLYLNLADFEVGEDGEVDAAAVSAAIDQLIVSKPYLAAQGRRFQGSADAGLRNEGAAADQLTREDVKTMTPDAITKAKDAGRLNDLLGVK